jgi:hypothetical protein
LHANVHSLGDIQSGCPCIMSAKWKGKEKILEDKNFTCDFRPFTDKDVLSVKNYK